MQSFSFHDELSVNIQSVYKGLVFFPWVMHQFGKLTNLVEDLVCFSYSLGEDSNMSIMVKASSSGELPGRSAGWIKDFASALQSQIPSQAHPHQTKNEGVLMTS